MSNDHSNNVCYNEGGAEGLAVALVVVQVVVALNDGKKVGHPVVLVQVVVDSPSCEALVVVPDKNDEVVLADNAYNHRHNAGRNHLQRTLFLVCLV